MPAPTERVFDVVADIGRRPDWLGELQWVDVPAEGALPGARFSGESALLLHRFAGESRVLRAEPARELAEEVILGARLRSTWTLEEVTGGTRVRHHVEIDFPAGPLGRVARWVLRWRMRSMQRRSLAALRSLVDS